LRKEKIVDLTFNESLLLEFVDDFLWVLADSNSKCLLDLGLFFPSISHVKKYLLLRYGVNIGDCLDLTSLLKSRTKTYQPRKVQVFTSDQIIEWSIRPNQNSCEH
jgi:hypothetical protein